MIRSGTIRFHLLFRVERHRNRSGPLVRPRRARPNVRSKSHFRRLRSQKLYLQNRLNLLYRVRLTTSRHRESLITIHPMEAERSHLLGVKIPRLLLLMGRSAYSLKTLKRSRRNRIGAFLAREASTKLDVCSGNSFIFVKF